MMNRDSAARIICNGKIVAAFRRGNSVATLVERFQLAQEEVEAVIASCRSDPVTFEADLLGAIGVRLTVSLQAYGALAACRAFASGEQSTEILRAQRRLLVGDAELLRDLGIGPFAPDWETNAREDAGDLEPSSLGAP